ncbi:MAG: helix-turn-helix domain-containing protein [Proteobacteria bacterium]|nr:helix-turn-helix domain-containing protein [Pseudomonadota bacterium]
MSITTRDTMGGLAKGLSVIETFGVEKPRQTISEVSAASGLDRATARRCLLTLAHLGYADYDGKFFTLNPRVLRLGTACLAAMPLPQIVQPWLDQLSETLGESTSVSILDDIEVVYIARAAQRKVMSVSLMPGSRLPAYCTSMGRVLLAALPEAEARERLERAPPPARTIHTLVEPAAIMAELARVRTQGYAQIDQEVELGLRSIAVPVMDSRGKIVAALNVGLPLREEDWDALMTRYLPPLLALQGELKKVLR